MYSTAWANVTKERGTIRTDAHYINVHVYYTHKKAGTGYLLLRDMCILHY